MSQLLQVATRVNGAVLIDAAGAIDHVDQGLPFTAAGALAVAQLGVIAYYHQGLPFTAAGRLATGLNSVVARVGNGGAPFADTEHLVLGSAVANRVSAGIGYTIAGRIATV